MEVWIPQNKAHLELAQFPETTPDFLLLLQRVVVSSE